MQNTPCFNSIMAGREGNRSQESRGDSSYSIHNSCQGGRESPWSPGHGKAALAPSAGSQMLSVGAQRRSNSGFL